MKVLRFVAAWLIAILFFFLRWSFRVRWHNDPRASLRQEGCPYAYAILHCHQISAIIRAEAGTCAMVSRSDDGDFLVPTLRINGILPIRGSTRTKGKSKGGELLSNTWLKKYEVELPHTWLWTALADPVTM